MQKCSSSVNEQSSRRLTGRCLTALSAQISNIVPQAYEIYIE